MTGTTPGFRQTLTWQGGFGGFLVLRKTRPDAERPIRLARVWVPVAALLPVFNVFMIVIGFTHPALIGYGGGTEQLIALSVVAVGLVSYFFTRCVQLRVRGHGLWRDVQASPARVTVRSGT